MSTKAIAKDRPEFVMLGEAARLLGITKKRMQSLVTRGDIPARRLPGARTDFSRTVIEQLQRDSEIPARRSA